MYMNEGRFLIVIALILLTASFLFARGARDTSGSAPPKKIVRITGVVRLVGTDLFREIVISNNEGEWYIAADEKEKLHNLQHQTVTVEGEETIVQLTYSGGIPAGKRYELSNIVVVSD